METQNGNGAETPLPPRERALPGWVGSFFLPALQIAVDPGSYQRTDNTNYDTSYNIKQDFQKNVSHVTSLLAFWSGGICVDCSNIPTRKGAPP